MAEPTIERQTLETPLVHIVVLNWNSWRDTLECLGSLERLDYPNYRVLVVDNGSTDGSEERIRESHPDIELIQTGENLGYAGGNNAGMRYVLCQGAEYILLVNPDVVLEPQTLSRMVRTAQSHPLVATLSPVIHSKDKSDDIWFGGSRIEWTDGEILHETTQPRTQTFHPSAWAAGCCLLLTSESLRTVGLFDEGYFLYFEETDLCQRMIDSGYLVGVCPDASAYHRECSSVKRGSPKHVYYLTRNWLHFFVRYAHKRGAARWRITMKLYRRNLLNLRVAMALLRRDAAAIARTRACIDFAVGRRGPSARYH
jgi:GT2 family glycosyltransferase